MQNGFRRRQSGARCFLCLPLTLSAWSALSFFGAAFAEVKVSHFGKTADGKEVQALLQVVYRQGRHHGLAAQCLLLCICHQGFSRRRPAGKPSLERIILASAGIRHVNRPRSR